MAILAETGMVSALFGSMGYAFVVTSYPENGMVVGEGLTDLVDLTENFPPNICNRQEGPFQ